MQIVGFIICISRTIARYRNENNSFVTQRLLGIYKWSLNLTGLVKMKMAGQNLVRFNPMGLYQNRSRGLFAVTDRQADSRNDFATESIRACRFYFRHTCEN